MTKRAYLAIDQGGHSSRAIVFDSQGQVVAKHRVAIATRRPAPAHVEHDPEELVRSIRTATETVVASLDATQYRITSAGLATQRSSIVCWDRTTGAALSPVLSWQDRRAHDWLARFADRADMIQDATGLFLTAYYGVSKLRWCLDHLPAVAAAHRAGRLAWGPLAGFLVARLTEQHSLLCDPANASRTLLLNIRSLDWDPELLAMFTIPGEPLPTCVPSRYRYGDLRVGSQRIPLDVVGGDQSVALFAFGRPAANRAYINVGTGAFVQRAMHAYPDFTTRLLKSLVFNDDRDTTYVLEGTVNGAGSALTEVERRLGMDAKAAQANAEQWLAQAQAPPLFINGISGLGSPYWTPDLESRFIGAGSDAEKIAAVVESIVFLLQVNMDELAKVTQPAAGIIITGGLSNLAGLCQRVADLNGLPVYRPDEHEATARGLAFLLAGLPDAWPESAPGTRFTPVANAPLRSRYETWYKELQAAIVQAASSSATQ